MHENAVEDAARVGIEPEGNIADAENCADFRNFLLDPLDRLQRFHSGGAVVFLAGGNG